MAAGRPADGCDAVAVDLKAGAVERKGGELVACPAESVAYVGHGAFEDVDFGAKAVFDANRQKAVFEEEVDLLGVDFFAGEHHVAATVDHQC